MLIEVTTRTPLGARARAMSEIVFWYQNCDVAALIVFRDEPIRASDEIVFAFGSECENYYSIHFINNENERQ